MRILMVTPYPPLRDGIAAYAVQTVARLRREGHDVEVLSPGPSAAHHYLDLKGPRGAAALAKRVRAYDEVIVQFHPDVFYPHPATNLERTAVSAALTAAFRAARRVEVRVHEIDYRHGEGHDPAAVATRLLWRSVDRITVHTQGERADFARSFGVPLDRIEVAQHGADFQRHTRHDRSSARETLGLAQDETVFLAIGFVQPHKGFDRAVQAFRAAGLGNRGCRLDVVGSVRLDDPAYLAHVELLERLADATPGAHLHLGYVSDEVFDRWLVAADVVVLPYRSIWSSSVLERAALYDRPVIITRVGGLADQSAGYAHVTLVDDDADLVMAMAEAAGAPAAREQVAIEPWALGDHVDRDAVLTEVRRRAAARRGSVVAVRNAQRVARTRASSASAPIRRLPLLAVPAPVSARPGATPAKKALRRATAWMLDPLVHQVNALQQATIDAIEGLDADK